MSEENGGDTHEADDEPAETESVPESERIPLSSLRERLEARGEDDVDDEAPLSELANEATASSEAERSELFAEMDVADVDADEVWDAVVEEGQPPEELLEEPEDEEAAEPTANPDEHVVNKREYCQRCEFFSDPPTVACGHDGTEIVEMPDSDTFRVRNCPKVEANDEKLRSMIDEEQS